VTSEKWAPGGRDRFTWCSMTLFIDENDSSTVAPVIFLGSRDRTQPGFCGNKFDPPKVSLIDSFSPADE
jgi:hypothetical protein